MIDIKNLHFAYGKKPVLDGLTLSLKPGHIYGLLGKNGTGKSTLLRNILGTLFPTKGEIKIGEYVPQKREPAFLQDIFIVAEEFYLPDVSINKFIANNAPFYLKFNKEQFDLYLKEFDIPANNSLQQMSYGQKKKVLISFALACNTSVLLMDEPTNGLDIVSKSQFRKVIAGITDETKCIIISTHQVKDLESLIDQITIIDDGKILFDESIETIGSRLSFSYADDENVEQNVIYHEASLNGVAIITPNTTNTESKVDLEMLYKAVLNNTTAVSKVFNS